jgi:hypothetical protein
MYVIYVFVSFMEKIIVFNIYVCVLLGANSLS